MQVHDDVSKLRKVHKNLEMKKKKGQERGVEPSFLQPSWDWCKLFDPKAGSLLLDLRMVPVVALARPHFANVSGLVMHIPATGVQQVLYPLDIKCISPCVQNTLLG